MGYKNFFKQPTMSLSDWANYDKCVEALKWRGVDLKWVTYQNHSLCKIAVTDEPMALEYVEPQLQTYEICMLAIERCPAAIMHVKHQSPEICKSALELSGLALKHVKNHTIELCQIAMNQTPGALKFIKFNQLPNCNQKTEWEKAFTLHILTSQ